MNIRLRRKAREQSSKLNSYPHQCQLYKLPPVEDISLEEFERLAVDRLKLLRDVESAGIKYKRGSGEYNSLLKKASKHMELHREDTTKSLTELYEERRRDHLSHFILRLAYCQSEDLKRWFIAQELDLFRYRLDDLSMAELDSFMKLSDLHYNQISDKEKKAKRSSLEASTFKSTKESIDETTYFKIHFTEALDLVRGRKVYIEMGYAYVPHQELVSIIQGVFRLSLSRHLAITARSLPTLDEDDRLMPMLNNLSHYYVGENYTKQSANRVTPEQVDHLSRESFPLCMRQLHQALRDNHHLKHFGRLQYGLFLKGIGMTLEDALRFWRTEFVKTMDGEKFEKGYSYNIRHSYGKEGKRANYTPYSCLKIIMSNAPGPGDYHGCPFKHTDPDLLRQRLRAYKLQKSAIEEVMELVKGQHYQLACVKYFELTHKVSDPFFLLNHPNQYYDESRRVLKGDDASVKTQKMDLDDTPTQTTFDESETFSDIRDDSLMEMDESSITDEPELCIQ